MRRGLRIGNGINLGWIDLVPRRGGGNNIPWYLAGGIAVANCIGAYKAKGAASYAASKVNLANPGTFDITDGATKPSWAAGTGWTFAGSESLFSTGITPANTQARSAVCKYIETDFAGLRTVFGVLSTNIFMVRYTNSSDQTVFQNGGAATPSRVTSGVAAIAGNKAYVDGVEVGTIPAGAYALAAPIGIGALNNGGTPVQNFIGVIEAWAYYDKTLNSTEVAAITQALS